MDHEFGKILRKIRISAGITQKELAEEIVVSASLISRYELGRAIPQIDTIRRILEVFGRFDISPDELRKLAEAGGYLREARETEEFLNRISESEYPEAVVSKYADEIRYPLDPAILHSDSPSLKDHLGRTGFAQALTIWLNRFWEEISQSDSNSFSMHIHGQWGIGKTTLLHLLGDELQPIKKRDFAERIKDLVREQEDLNWVVVWFNAWQNQHIEPLWWPFMDKIYRDATRQLISVFWKPLLTLRIVVWEQWWRFRTGHPFYLLALVASLMTLALLFSWIIRTGFPDTSNFLFTLGDTAKSFGAILALVTTIWSGTLFFSRSLLLGSANSAQEFVKFAPDPMERIRIHFNQLIEHINYPIIVFIDDLDRCNTEQVVHLLESIQTLFNNPKIFYVVSADRRWLYACFETVYSEFKDMISEPGRRLGSLFLEKVFQLSVSVPKMSLDAKELYLDHLLKGGDFDIDGILLDEREAARQEFAGLNTDEQIIEKLLRPTDDPIKNLVRREEAVKQSASQEVSTSTEHFLNQFVHLLEPNPRSIKRLVNTYGVYRALAMLSDINLISDIEKRKQIVLWIIISLRWPTLLEFLEKNPDQVDIIRQGNLNSLADNEINLKALAMNEDVRSVLNGSEIGVVLDKEAVERFIGVKVSSSTTAVVA